MRSVLEDKDEIRDLICKYCFCLDEHDFKEWAKLFTEDGIFDASFLGTAQGRPALQEFMEGIVPTTDEGPARKHIMSNVHITVNGDTAEGTSYYLMVRGHAKEAKIGASGRYFDTFARVDGKWLFKVRRVTMELIGDMGLKRYS